MSCAVFAALRVAGAVSCGKRISNPPERSIGLIRKTRPAACLNSATRSNFPSQACKVSCSKSSALSKLESKRAAHAAATESASRSIDPSLLSMP